MTTTVELLREAESQGYLVFWAEGAYHFAPKGRESDRAFWSYKFSDLEACASGALSAALAVIAANETASLKAASLPSHRENLMLAGIAIGLVVGAALVAAAQLVNACF